MRYSIIFGTLLVAMMGCIEPYDFEVTDTAEVLVIDGLLTNEQKEHEVKLSLSGSLDNNINTPISGAEVWITEDEAIRIDLTELESGIYRTAPTIAGKPGSSYQLGIKLKDGKTYQSSIQKLSEPVEIDSVYGQYLELPSQEDDQIIEGVQFFVDTHDFTSEASFFRYEYEEDYIIRVRYPSRFEWYSDTQTYGPRKEDIGTCYGHIASQGLIIASTSGLSENRLSEFPILTVKTSDTQLYHRFAIILRQYSISSSAYQYYKKLQENNESAGSFFDKQKGAVVGNMTNIDNQAESVLGYFEVSALSSQTNFFSTNDFVDEGFKPEGRYSSSCNPEVALDTLAISSLSNSTMAGKNIYDFPFMPPGLVVLAAASCSDCRIYASNVKPDYWD